MRKRSAIEIHRQLMERVAAGDSEGELELIHPDVELRNRPDAMEVDVVRGRDGYREIVAETNEHFDKWRFEVEEYIDAGEYLVVVGRPRGEGRLSGIKLEDLDAFSDPEVSLWRFRDGMIIEHRCCRTRQEALEAVGLEVRPPLDQGRRAHAQRVRRRNIAQIADVPRRASRHIGPAVSSRHSQEGS